MVIAKHEASAFIQGYKQLMAEIHGPLPAKRKLKLLEILTAARKKLLADRSLLDCALRQLGAKSVSIPDEVVAAIRSLEVRNWIYLRDTRSHAVFIDPLGEGAYGVLGLTERVRNLMGGSGAVVETGLVRYLGRYVTDGIVSHVVWLGPNYKKDLVLIR